MQNQVIVRSAVVSERKQLEDLQWRASLNNPEDRDALRQGIGRALIEHCASAAKAHGAKSLNVMGNPHAENFYVACGFKMVGLCPQALVSVPTKG